MGLSTVRDRGVVMATKARRKADAQRPIFECVRTQVYQSWATNELYVFAALPENGKFSLGDKVRVGVLLEKGAKNRAK